ncbi:NAD(P)-dependent oxidoreductase, partial [Streptomyces brasiliscabiei]
ALNLLRKTKVFSNKVQEGDFLWAPDIADELSQQTVGVVGTGRIGQAAIKIYQGFGAKVLAYDVFQNPDLVKKGLYVNTLTELYQKADILTLHIP